MRDVCHVWSRNWAAASTAGSELAVKRADSATDAANQTADEQDVGSNHVAPADCFWRPVSGFPSVKRWKDVTQRTSEDSAQDTEEQADIRDEQSDDDRRSCQADTDNHTNFRRCAVRVSVPEELHNGISSGEDADWECHRESKADRDDRNCNVSMLCGEAVIVQNVAICV